MSDFGLTIDGKHTSEFGLRLLSMYIPQPEPKVKKISVPWASGSIDLSEVAGQVNYEDRNGIKLEFTVADKSYSAWAAATTAIAMWVHGKKVKVVPDNDIGFYYMCRLEVDSKKDNPVLSSFSLSGTAEPFKYEVQASDEDWLWDPFNFETGVIRENLIDIVIGDANKNVTIYGGGIPTVPEFIVTEAKDLTLFFGNRVYDMSSPGTYRVPAVKVGADDVRLTFTGTGKLSIRYRGRYL